MHLIQAVVYFIMPAIVIGVTQGLKENRDAAVVIGAVVPFGINLCIQILGYTL